MRIRHLAIAEAIAMRLWEPELCIQKKLMHDVSLPWSLWLILSIYLLSCFRFFLFVTKTMFFTVFKILFVFITILVIQSVIPDYFFPIPHSSILLLLNLHVFTCISLYFMEYIMMILCIYFSNRVHHMTINRFPITLSHSKWAC